MVRKILPLLLIVGTFLGPPAVAFAVSLDTWRPNTPMAFEPNRGQTDARVDFLVRGQGYSAFVTPTGAVLRFHSIHMDYAVSLVLVGSSPEPRAAGLDRVPGQSHYFRGSDAAKWSTAVPHYRAVEYRGVYHNIDLRYYGNGHRLEYDFVVHPGADLNDIRIAFPGAAGISIDAAGDLVLRLHDTERSIRFEAPLTYQEIDGVRTIVASRYVIATDREVGFVLFDYDPDYSIVIDPVLDYGSYWGGTGEEEAVDIAVDAAGNLYATGPTLSTNFPTTAGVLDAVNDTTDVFVTKLSADGDSLIYSTYLGGSGVDKGAGIDVDASGNAYVTGVTYSADFPVQNAYQGTRDGNEDAFLAKLNPDGSALLYSSYLGGGNVSGNIDEGMAIAVDASGHAVVAGKTGSSDFPTKNAMDSSRNGVTDAFVAKFDATASGNASLVFCTLLGGSTLDQVHGVVVDGNGDICLIGATSSSNFPTVNEIIATNTGSFDPFVCKMAGDGSVLLYSTYLGGSGWEYSGGIDVDSDGNIYVTGWTPATDFPVTTGAYSETYNGGSYDIWAAKIDPTGSGLSSLVYCTYIGGAQSELGYDIAVDSEGRAHIGGLNQGGFPVTPDAHDNTLSGSQDAVYAVLDAAGSNLDYGTYLGGGGGERAYGVAVDGADRVYLAGYTTSSSMQGDLAPNLFGPRGSKDAFVLRFSPLPAVLVVDTAVDSLDGDTSSIKSLMDDRGFDGRISLREAIAAANKTAGLDTIRFAITLSDSGHVYYADDSTADTLSTVVHTTLDDASIADFDPDYPGGALSGYSWYRIQVRGTPLPVITEAVFLDATTQPGFAGKPIVEINGGLLVGGGLDGLSVTGGSSTIRGFVVNRFSGSGIELDTQGGNTVAGNYLGTNVTGMYSAANSGEGVFIDASPSNVVGGTAPSDRNVISGNFWRGILIEDPGSFGNAVEGNFIGTDFTGTAPIPNQIGVYLYDAPGNTIGGTAAGAGNVVSGNTQFGIYVVFAGSTGNKIQGNTIGLDAPRAAGVPNGFAGIELLDGDANTVGGVEPGAGNVIALNDSIGVSIGGTTTTDIAILSNSIYGHPGLGIDLARDGVTANDSADIDTGHNDLMNFPVMTSAVWGAGTVTVDYELDLPAGNYRIEFFSNPTGANPSGYGEGAAFVDSDDIVHTGSGIESFSYAFAASVGDTLSATVTECLDPACTTFASTSEFSRVVAVVATYDIAGRVFMDDIISGGVGEPFNTTDGDAAIGGARVELFDASDAFEAFTTTDGFGNYTFSSVPGGSIYKVRVVAGSMGAGVGALPEQTFESDGTINYGSFGTAMGGVDPLIADTVATATLVGAEHWVAVALGATNVTGVDFGFSYEVIVNTNDSGQGSLRRFLDNAKGIAGIQNSQFNIPTSDPSYTSSPLAYVIQPLTALPEITDTTIVDGTTQPGFSATPIIVLNGALAGATANGLHVSAGATTVRGLVIEAFTLSGVYVTGAGGNTIAGNYVGVDVTGLVDRGNGTDGIFVDADTGGNTIGGVLLSERNLISGNGGNGILLRATNGNFVLGNYVGTDKNGVPSIGNTGHGVLIDGGDNNAIGGQVPGQGNSILGNGQAGVMVSG